MVQKQGGGIGSGIAPAPRRIQIGVPDGSRTHNTTILSRFPLPVGILGRLASSGGAALPPRRVWYAYHIAHTRFFKLPPRSTWVFYASATRPPLRPMRKGLCYWQIGRRGSRAGHAPAQHVQQPLPLAKMKLSLILPTALLISLALFAQDAPWRIDRKSVV